MFFFFKQKTAYEMRIRDWSSDVCSSDLILESGDGDVRRRGTDLRHDRHIIDRHVDRLSDQHRHRRIHHGIVPAKTQADRKSVVYGKSVSVRVDLGGRSIIKKNKNTE